MGHPKHTLELTPVIVQIHSLLTPSPSIRAKLLQVSDWSHFMGQFKRGEGHLDEVEPLLLCYSEAVS